MFDSSKNISTRLADAADLLIDFATLGEYGLEPAAKAEPRAARPATAAAAPTSSATNRRRRPGAPTLVLATEEPRSRRRHQIDGPFLLRP